MKELKELDDKIAQLKKTRDELIKGWGSIFGLGGSQTSGQSGGATQGNISGSTTAETGKPSIAEQIGMKKKEKKHEDEKEDKKMIAEALDEHNEKKHGEPKDKDSAFKAEKVEVAPENSKNRQSYKQEFVKFEKNGQWSLDKGDVMAPRPKSKLDVPVKDVYNGDDHTKEVGGKSVDGDKGKTVKAGKNP